MAAMDSDGTEDTRALILCISQHVDRLEANAQSLSGEAKQWLLVLCGALIFFMQAGFAVSGFKDHHFT